MGEIPLQSLEDYIVKCEVLKKLSIKIRVLQDVISCRTVNIYISLEEASERSTSRHGLCSQNIYIFVITRFWYHNNFLHRYVIYNEKCVCNLSHVSFWAALAKLRKATRLLVLSCLSVHPSLYVTTRLPLDGLSWNLYFEHFSKNCRENSNFTKIGQEYRALYMNTDKYFWS